MFRSLTFVALFAALLSLGCGSEGGDAAGNPEAEKYGVTGTDSVQSEDQIKKQMEMSAGMGKEMAGDAGADAGEISGADAGTVGEKSAKAAEDE
ncbi:MAG: hypothetical protein CMJ59_08435 [Planctomycetaceae bacterium]|nr:hypothetical protein [Planctomycetaceae bacterium]